MHHRRPLTLRPLPEGEGTLRVTPFAHCMSSYEWEVR